MTEQGPDFIVSELLAELKAGNIRKDAQIKTLQRTLRAIVIAAFITYSIVIGAFLLYLNQYDFVSENTTNNTAEGVYALIDSEGNIVGTDLTAEEVDKLMEDLANGSGAEE